MHNNESIIMNKGFVLKLICFCILISFIIMSYIESKSLIDIISLVIVIIIFSRFLFVKLYQ